MTIKLYRYNDSPVYFDPEMVDKILPSGPTITIVTNKGRKINGQFIEIC